MTSRGLTLAALAALLSASVAWADTTGQQLAEEAGRTLIGTPAPPLVLKTIDGQSLDLRRLYGHKAVYLKFWATWCVPCREQMPHFEHTYEGAGPDLEVIGVNTGFNDSIEEVKAYRRQMGLKMPIVIDDGRLADALHLRVTPQHVVIGRDGKVDYIGHLVDDRLEASLKSARAQPVNALQSDLHAADTLARYKMGEPVSAEALKTLDGQQVLLWDSARKQSTVLVFLSPWCESYLAESRPQRAAACKRAREQSETLAGKSNLRWIGIASGLWATTEDLAAYRTEQHVTIPLHLDETGALFRRFDVRDVPTVIVVDATGHIARRIDEVTSNLRDQLSGSAAAGR